ncbi:hypothetical protein HAX54_017048 [Datura stramonium]|uniref:F-box associated beta-propeller type 3 domain-containing protein n=1 Tax=Datura stramonium TaxID=4076 RepID=A0ABS8UK13_DATST|nr:hypothetical protein [Datura stramonium]
MHLHIHAKNQNSQKLLIGQACGSYAFYLYSSSLLASSSSSSQLAKDLRRLDSPTSSKLCHARVYCCCDGLFFMGIWSNPYSTLLMLWNSSTRESIILPGHPEEEYTYGTGCDSTSDDYKILGVDMNDEASDQILSLKRGSWRNIEETSVRLSDTIISDREVCLPFVHGALHWIGMSYPSRSVVSFNISDEKYGEIPLPAFEYCPAVVRMGVSVLGGRLCVYRDSIITFNL